MPIYMALKIGIEALNQVTFFLQKHTIGKLARQENHTRTAILKR